MVSTIQVDYPAEESRGKLAAMVGMAIGLGAVMIGVLFTRFPDMYRSAGFGDLGASRMTMFTMTGFCIVTAVAARIGLAAGPSVQATGKPGVRKLLRDGLAAAAANPKILLVYASGFVGRADLVVVGTFYSLWLTQAGIESGKSPEESAAFAGGMFAVVMIAPGSGRWHCCSAGQATASWVGSATRWDPGCGPQASCSVSGR